MAAVRLRTVSSVWLLALIPAPSSRASGYEFTLALRRPPRNEARSRLRCGCPHRCRAKGRTPSAEGKRRSHDGSLPGRTLQGKLATEGFDAVGEPAEARAAGDACAAASVVADLDDDVFA